MGLVVPQDTGKGNEDDQGDTAVLHCGVAAVHPILTIAGNQLSKERPQDNG